MTISSPPPPPPQNKTATVIKAFHNPHNDPTHLTLAVGDQVLILDLQLRNHGFWYRGFILNHRENRSSNLNETSKNQIGFFPASHVSIDKAENPNDPELPLPLVPEHPPAKSLPAVPESKSNTGNNQKQSVSERLNALRISGLQIEPLSRTVNSNPRPRPIVIDGKSHRDSSKNTASFKNTTKENVNNLEYSRVCVPKSPAPSIPDLPLTPPPGILLDCPDEVISPPPSPVPTPKHSFLPPPPSEINEEIVKGLLAMCDDIGECSYANYLSNHEALQQLYHLYSSSCSDIICADKSIVKSKLDDISGILSAVNQKRNCCLDSDTRNLKEKSGVIRKGDKNPVGTHLYFDLKACVASICGNGETAELYFSLYNGSEKRFISEDYLVTLTYNGMPKDIEKIGSMNTVFADLSKRDLTPSSSLFLVCKIIRNGRILLGNGNTQTVDDQISNKSAFTYFRRPFGWALLDVSAYLQETGNYKEKEFTMRIFTASSEQLFPTLYENIMNQSGGYETNTRAETMCVALRRIDGSLGEAIDESIPVTKRMGFPDVILPGDIRNSLYLTIISGDFSQGRKTTAKNIEITIQLRCSSGEVLRNAVYCGGDETCDTFESIVYYHNNNPRWNETIRLDIPCSASVDKGMHLFFTFRHCSATEKSDKSEKAFAFAAFPLIRSDDAVIHDQNYTLHLFKYDKKHVSPDIYIPAIVYAVQVDASDAFMNVESSLVTSAHNSKLVLLKDVFTMQTKLCSTKLTQNVSLLNLLRWRTLPPSDMHVVLKDFTFIGPMEIIKYLQDILDALFSILQCQDTVNAEISCDDLSDLVFSALTFVINIVINDRRFVHFRSILEVYVRNHFGKKEEVCKIWKPMLGCLQRLANNPHDPILAKELRSAIKAWEFLFKFIVRSWISSLRYETVDYSVWNTCEQLFNTVMRTIMHQETAHSSLFGTQVLVLQNIHQALVELINLPNANPTFVASTLIACLSTISSDNKIALDSKLHLCSKIVNGPLFFNQQMRSLLIVTISETIRAQLFSTSDTIARQVLLEMLLSFCDISSLETELSSAENRQIVTLLPSLIQQISSQYDEAPVFTDYSCALLSSLLLLTADELIQFLTNRIRNLKSLSLLDQLLACVDLWAASNGDIFLPRDILNSNWHRICLKVLSASLACLRTFNSHDSVNQSSVLVKICCVSTKILPPCDRDLTENSGADLIKTIWEEFAHYRDDFVKLLVRPLLRLTFCQFSPKLAITALQILLEMIHFSKSSKKMDTTRESPTLEFMSNQHHSNNKWEELVFALSPVEIELIGHLDHFVMNEGLGDDQYRQWILAYLENQSLLSRQSVLPLLQSLEKFLALAFSIRSSNSPATSSLNDALDVVTASEDLSTHLLYNLIHFTALLNRTSIFLKYVHRLCDIHIQNGNYGEAASALRHHADIYYWNTHDQVPGLDQSISLDILRLFLFSPQQNSKNGPKKLKDSPESQKLYGLLREDKISAMYTVQSAFERKESLYLICIQLLIMAQHYEKGIELAEALSREYSRTCFDFSKVSLLYRILADIAHNLNSTDRFFPEYYRVAFVGLGWRLADSVNKYLYNKSYIYSGKPWEKLGEFIDRIMAQYPDAELLRSNSWPPDDETQNSEKMFIQIASVTPVPNTNRFSRVFDAQNYQTISDRVRAWYEHNETSHFLFTRPFKKTSNRTSDNEFLSLWTEEFLFKTEMDFPHFLHRSEIIDVSRKEITPIENSIKNIEAKNRELLRLERSFSALCNDLELRKPEAKQSSRFSLSNQEKRKSDGTTETPPPSPISPKINCNPLTMAINGAVDAPVNGGIPMYRKAFLQPAFEREHPEFRDHIKILRSAIDEQVKILYRCINLHEVIAPPELRPLHATIFDCKFLHCVIVNYHPF